MKAVVELTTEEYDRYSKIYANLCEKIGESGTSELIIDLKQTGGYAHYKFSGTVSDTLVEKLGRMPTEVELIMLIDSGFSHFGASCTIIGKGFSGRVNTD